MSRVCVCVCVCVWVTMFGCPDSDPVILLLNFNASVCKGYRGEKYYYFLYCAAVTVE